MKKYYVGNLKIMHEHNAACDDDPKCRVLYLASDVDARIAELESALRELVAAHARSPGFQLCICAAHEQARKLMVSEQ
jgi:hypothetical protein